MARRLLTDDEINAVLDELRAEAKRKRQEPHQLFTMQHVADLLERRYGVRYNKGNVWRRMQGCGWKFKRSPLTYEERMAAYEARYGKKR